MFKYFVAIVAIIISSSLFYSEASFAVDAKDSEAFQLYKQQLEKKQKISAGKQSAENSKSSSSRSSSRSAAITDEEAMEQLDAYWRHSIVQLNFWTIRETCYNEYGKKVNPTDKVFQNVFYSILTQAYGIGFYELTGETPELSPQELKETLVDGKFFYLKKQRDASGAVVNMMRTTDNELNIQSKCIIIAGVLVIENKLEE